MTDYTVKIQPDFLERQAKAQPIAAVAELIWNGLDADAPAITVDLEDDNLGGLSRIIVTDNGQDIPYSEAPLSSATSVALGRSTARPPRYTSVNCTGRETEAGPAEDMREAA